MVTVDAANIESDLPLPFFLLWSLDAGGGMLPLEALWVPAVSVAWQR